MLLGGAETQYAGLGMVPDGEGGNVVKFALIKEMPHTVAMTPVIYGPGNTVVTNFWDGDEGSGPIYEVWTIAPSAGRVPHVYIPPAPIAVNAGDVFRFNGWSDELPNVSAMLYITILRTP